MKHPLRFTLILVVAIIVIGVVATRIIIWQSPTFPPPPNPNGYDDFVTAGSLLDDKTSDLHEMPHAELRDYMSTNSEAMRLIGLGLTRTSAVPTLGFLTNFNARILEVTDSRKVAQFWVASGRLAEFENHTNEAARIYVEGIRYGAGIARGGLLIHDLVAFACEALATTPLARLIPGLDTETARTLAAKLEAIDQNATTWDEVWSIEKIFMRQEVRKAWWKPREWINYWQGIRTFSKQGNKHDAFVARRRLMATELALRCYLAENQQPPNQLAELVPKYLQAVPHDPFSQKPLIYRAQGTNWLLYSVGRDGKNDRGTRPTVTGAMRDPPPSGDLFYDSR